VCVYIYINTGYWSILLFVMPLVLVWGNAGLIEWVAMIFLFYFFEEPRLFLRV
jgi:hypothetical protein